MFHAFKRCTRYFLKSVNAKMLFVIRYAVLLKGPYILLIAVWVIKRKGKTKENSATLCRHQLLHLYQLLKLFTECVIWLLVYTLSLMTDSLNGHCIYVSRRGVVNFEYHKWGNFVEETMAPVWVANCQNENLNNYIYIYIYYIYNQSSMPCSILNGARKRNQQKFY